MICEIYLILTSTRLIMFSDPCSEEDASVRDESAPRRQLIMEFDHATWEVRRSKLRNEIPGH